MVHVVFLVLLVAAPSFILFSTEGPGSMHAPIALSLVAGLVVGALAQKTRLCMVGGIRDAVLFRDFYLLWGFIAILVAALIGNLVTGNFTLSFAGQPVAHTDGLWNAAWHGAHRLCQRAAGRLPAAPADLGGQRQQRQRRHRAGHVGRRRLCATISAWPLRPMAPRPTARSL